DQPQQQRLRPRQGPRHGSPPVEMDEWVTPDALYSTPSSLGGGQAIFRSRPNPSPVPSPKRGGATAGDVLDASAAFSVFEAARLVGAHDASCVAYDRYRSPLSVSERGGGEVWAQNPSP